MADRRFVVMTTTTTIVLVFSWTLFAYVASAVGFDVQVFVELSALSVILVAGDIGLWVLVRRLRSRRPGA